MRLAKYLAHSGVASRRKAEDMVAAGRVSVGGKIVRDPARDVEFESGVEVDGRPVGPEPREVWMLNKPTGVTSTASEPGRRRAVTELIDSKRRLYPVGQARRRVDGPDPDHQRRRARQPPHASALRGPAHLPRATAAPPRRGGPAASALRGRARGRPHGPGEGPAGVAARDRDHDPRGPQPAGAPDGGGDRQRGGRPRAHSRSARCGLASWHPARPARLRAAELRKLWQDPGG